MEKGWLELKRFFANARSCVEGKKALLLETPLLPKPRIRTNCVRWRSAMASASDFDVVLLALQETNSNMHIFMEREGGMVLGLFHFYLH